MENTNESNYVSANDSSSEEPTAFPYLLTLEADIELSDNEPVETMAQEEEIKETPPKTVAAEISNTNISLPQVNPIPNPATSAPTAASSTATSPATATATNHEDTYPVNETISTLQTQLADAQKEITSLRHRVEQYNLRFRGFGRHILTLERAIWHVKHLCPNFDNALYALWESLSQATQFNDPVEKNTEAEAETLDNKRKREVNPTQQQAKRPMLVEANATGSEEKNSYEGRRPHCPNCNRHHEGPCGAPCGRCKIVGHQAKDCKFPNIGANSKTPKACFECGGTGHLRNGCPQLKNNNKKMGKTTGRVIVNNTKETGQNPNFELGTLLSNDLTFFNLVQH